MGTRGLTKVIDRNGVTKVAQYGQWDHYPAGQGTKILDILTSRYNSVKMLELALDKCEFVSDAKREVIYAGYNAKYADVVDYSHDVFSAILPSLSRDTCGDILNVVIWSAGTVPLIDESEFEKDDLFCEGVYEINYQTNKFVSTFAGVKVEFDLDKLPETSDYLKAFDIANGVALDKHNSQPVVA
jgi:hypothetical protein